MFARLAEDLSRRTARVPSWLVGALLLTAGVGLPWLTDPAQSAPSATNQALPSLADTPGDKSSLPNMDRALDAARARLRAPRVSLDSDVLLKIYVYAWSGRPVDYMAVLTENTDNIVPPPPVRPTDAQRREIDELVRQARQHPDVLIDATDVALEPFDPATGGYEMDNRLFQPGAKYYFDNSPFHFAYADAQSFLTLHAADARTRSTLTAAIANYEHFELAIEARVTGASGSELSIAPRRVTLKDAVGGTVLTQEPGSSATAARR